MFQEKFMFTLLEGLRDLKVVVWNSNTLSTDDFIGNATYVSAFFSALHFSIALKFFGFWIESFLPLFVCCD